MNNKRARVKTHAPQRITHTQTSQQTNNNTQWVKKEMIKIKWKNKIDSVRIETDEYEYCGQNWKIAVS